MEICESIKTWLFEKAFNCTIHLPTHISTRPWSQPLITWPAPNWKVNGWSRSKLHKKQEEGKMHTHWKNDRKRKKIKKENEEKVIQMKKGF